MRVVMTGKTLIVGVLEANLLVAVVKQCNHNHYLGITRVKSNISKGVKKCLH